MLMTSDFKRVSWSWPWGRRRICYVPHFPLNECLTINSYYILQYPYRSTQNSGFLGPTSYHCKKQTDRLLGHNVHHWKWENCFLNATHWNGRMLHWNLYYPSSPLSTEFAHPRACCSSPTHISSVKTDGSKIFGGMLTNDYGLHVYLVLIRMLPSQQMNIKTTGRFSRQIVCAGYLIVNDPRHDNLCTRDEYSWVQYMNRARVQPPYVAQVCNEFHCQPIKYSGVCTNSHATHATDWHESLPPAVCSITIIESSYLCLSL